MGNSDPYRSRGSLKSLEASSQGVPEIGELCEKLVMVDGSFSFPPEVFDGIELW